MVADESKMGSGVTQSRHCGLTGRESRVQLVLVWHRGGQGTCCLSGVPWRQFFILCFPFIGVITYSFNRHLLSTHHGSGLWAKFWQHGIYSSRRCLWTGRNGEGRPSGISRGGIQGLSAPRAAKFAADRGSRRKGPGLFQPTSLSFPPQRRAVDLRAKRNWSTERGRALAGCLLSCSHRVRGPSSESVGLPGCGMGSCICIRDTSAWVSQGPRKLPPACDNDPNNL